MNRDNLRKVEVFGYRNEVEYTAYFQGFYTKTYYNNSNELKAIVELEDGEIITAPISNVRFIS